MKTKLILFLIVLLPSVILAQDRKFSLEANYPITIDKNALGADYDGAIDIGFDYIFARSLNFDLGLGFNAGWLSSSRFEANDPNRFKSNIYTIQPKIYGELVINSIPNLHPQFGLGYSLFVFDISGTFPQTNLNQRSETTGGMNFLAALVFDVSERMFIQFQYDFVKLTRENNIPDTKYYNNVNLLKLGLGYRF